jgi:hypothetical protein
MRAVLLAIACALVACGHERAWECLLEEGQEPEYVQRIGCEADFEAVASRPLDASMPGARSVKTVIDLLDGEALYYQHSGTYPMHHDFALAHLSGGGLPVVAPAGEFSATEYTSPSRRFILGALTHYEGPGLWCYEIAPYDTAPAGMIEKAYRMIRESTFIGGELRFHPTSAEVEEVAGDLPPSVRVVTTEELHEGIDYQPLNLGESHGQLRFDAAVSFRDIVVLDHVPGDICVVMGIVTSEFQTPLSHVNVLSQNRGTPNMAWRGAWNDERLRSLEGEWVHLVVEPFSFSIEPSSRDEADAWWEEHGPDAVEIPELDTSVTDLVDAADVLDPALPLGEALEAAIPAFGGKASHLAALTAIGEQVPVPVAFVIPVSYYRQFMTAHGFDADVEALLADEAFLDDPLVRDESLGALRGAMMSAEVDPALEADLLAKLAADHPGTRMRFRSSTNAEDLDGFTGAGLYTSASGEPGDPERPVLDAVRTVWAGTWNLRAFEERSYRGIDHTGVGMAVLVHRSFPDEEANGVALTANPYDITGLEPGFYVNVQIGEESVVLPDPGVTSDQFIYYFEMPGQPVSYIGHSSLIPDGTTVLTRTQIHSLGVALMAIHDLFRPIYGTVPGDWYAMDVEFKFDGDPGEVPALVVKQARPHPGWGP